MQTRENATGSKSKRALKYLSIAYVLLLAACCVALILIDIFQGIERTEVGCYFQNALIAVAHCEGFIGAETVALILNLPYWLFYAPLFVGYSIAKGPFSSEILLLGVGLWAPIIYLLWQEKYGKLVLIALTLTLIALMLEGAGVIF